MISRGKSVPEKREYVGVGTMDNLKLFNGIKTTTNARIPLLAPVQIKCLHADALYNSFSDEILFFISFYFLISSVHVCVFVCARCSIPE